MRSIITFGILGLLAISASATFTAFSYNSSDPTTVQDLKYYFSIFRGIDSGYEKGMYKKTSFSVGESCFGVSMLASFYSMIL